ncbi:hypothetical protein EY04_17210 [Pseudomonas chlororaphis]|nr:hypothetical protein EY04_17210 [Pseudomonas chlororaphis]
MNYPSRNPISFENAACTNSGIEECPSFFVSQLIHVIHPLSIVFLILLRGLPVQNFLYRLQSFRVMIMARHSSLPCGS